jgi:phage repressor protein C with HTH and peptisase S24 domain
MKNRKITEEQLKDAARLKSAWETYKKTKGATQEQLALALGWTQGAVSQYLLGKVALNTDALIKFSVYLNVNPKEISPDLAEKLINPLIDPAIVAYPNDISEIKDYPCKKKYPRVVGTAKCGDKGYYMDLEGGDGYIEFDAAPGSIAIRIKGHSMHPAIREGWYVVIEPDKEVTPGEYVLAKFKDGKKMVKELIKINSDGYLMLSVNGDKRITAGYDELEDIQAITAIVPPSRHREF